MKKAACDPTLPLFDVANVTKNVHASARWTLTRFRHNPTLPLGACAPQPEQAFDASQSQLLPAAGHSCLRGLVRAGADFTAAVAPVFAPLKALV